MTLQEIVSLLAFSWGGVALMRRYALNHGIVDKPNARSAHEQITPRAGGVAFVLVFLSWCLAKGLQSEDLQSFSLFMLMVACGALIALLGFLDDRFQLSPALRSVVQWMVACFASVIIGALMPELWWGLPFAFTVLIWSITLVASTNFYNFMDGSDGFSTIQGLFLFGFLGALAQYYGDGLLAQSAWALSLTLVGFLYWNWPKAKIFMGDVGSGFLGFMIILMTLWLIAKTPQALWPLFIMYGIFWFDPILTLLRRVRFKDKITCAHNQHAYQRLLRSGRSKTQLLVGQVVLNAFLMGLAIITAIFPQYTGGTLLLAVILMALCYYHIENRCPQKPYHGG